MKYTINMESEVKLEEGREVDLVMIASETKKRNRTMELGVVKQKLNTESELEKKEARGADRTDLRRGTQEMIMTATWIAIVPIITSQKVLTSNGGK